MSLGKCGTILPTESFTNLLITAAMHGSAILKPPYADPAQLQEFAEWIVSTDTEKATGAALPTSVTYGEEEYTHDTSEYRLAKFKAEAGDYEPWGTSNATIHYIDEGWMDDLDAILAD